MRPREAQASDSWSSPRAATPANEMALLQLVLWVERAAREYRAELRAGLTTYGTGRPARRHKQLCETAHNCIYVQRSIMCSGGVVIGVFPAQRESGGCAAEHNRQVREDHRARRDAKWTSAGWASPRDRPAGLRRWFPGIPEPAARIAISGRPAPDRPGDRDIDRSTCRSPLPRAVDYAQQSVH